jgi:hypothetical protein
MTAFSKFSSPICTFIITTAVSKLGDTSTLFSSLSSDADTSMFQKYISV